MYRLFLQQNKCAQIIFATFQAIRKLSRYPKLSRLSGNFLDHPENMQPIRKRFRLSRNFSDHQENIQPIRKISSLSGKHPAYPENIQPIRKLSSLSGNFSGYPETFQAIQKLSRSSGKYPAYPENFQTIRKKSRLSGNFPKGPETSQCNFKGYAQKLSGRAKTFRMAMPPCHPGFWDSGGSITSISQTKNLDVDVRSFFCSVLVPIESQTHANSSTHSVCRIILVITLIRIISFHFITSFTV